MHPRRPRPAAQPTARLVAAVLVAAVLAATALVTAGCTDDGGPWSADSRPPIRTVPPNTAPPSGPAAERAARVAAAWSGSERRRVWLEGYHPLMADEWWYPAGGLHNDDDWKAFWTGRLDLRAVVAPPPATGDVVFPDGSRLTLPLNDLPALLRHRAEGRPECPPTTAPTTPATQPAPSNPSNPSSLPAPTASAPPPPACPAPLTVTSARLVSREQDTSRGTARVPAWELTLAGYTAPAWFVAVSSQAPPPEEPVPERIEGAEPVRLVVGDRSTERRLTGAVTHSDCTELLPGEAYETADAVVLIGHLSEPTRELCDPYRGFDFAEFALAAPLGDRVVLDLRTGEPLHVERAWRQ